MSSPRVTIVTPTYNRRALLEETIASIRNQDMAHWQMVVVDDASIDDTWAWLEGLSEPRVESIRLEKMSERSAARNTGFRRARGEFVLFLDDDDLLTRSALSRHMAALERHPQALASVASLVWFAEDGTEVLQSFVGQGEELVRSVWEDVLLGWTAMGGATLFRADAIRAIGGYDESYVIAEDYELWTRLALQGPVVFSSEVVLRYRVHSGQWRSKNFLELMDAIRTSAVARSDGEHRIRGQRALQSRVLVLDSAEHAQRNNHARALWTYLHALRVAKGLLSSPLVATIATLNQPSIWRMVVKALLPKFVLRRARRWRDTPEERAPSTFQVELRSESDGRHSAGAAHVVDTAAGKMKS